jgi:hypothetical protein
LSTLLALLALEVLLALVLRVSVAVVVEALVALGLAETGVLLVVLIALLVAHRRLLWGTLHKTK